MRTSCYTRELPLLTTYHPMVMISNKWTITHFIFAKDRSYYGFTSVINPRCHSTITVTTLSGYLAQCLNAKLSRRERECAQKGWCKADASLFYAALNFDRHWGFFHRSWPHPACPSGNILEDLWTCGRFILRPTLWGKGLLIFSLLRMVHTEFRNRDLKFSFIDSTGPFVWVRTFLKKIAVGVVPIQKENNV